MPVPCYFTDKIHLAYRSYIGKFAKGVEKIGHPTARQYPYCEKLFAKTKENMKHHVKFVQLKKASPIALTMGI